VDAPLADAEISKDNPNRVVLSNNDVLTREINIIIHSNSLAAPAITRSIAIGKPNAKGQDVAR
jgi:hypothetical protein